ncbi:hypothetical protein LAZ67_21001547 [Cordylochernes scorpioides]|uniref:CCHC-type domain-containing protein n=1 Tax=Cordylochernes scorpioides TaxID=51811 RepID=A0ABY6LQ48_9ARAC|nr:hypothetical protein LAZ67_21001547 [Cordylochernes scorpioides]
MTSTLINTPLEKLNDQNYRSYSYNGLYHCTRSMGYLGTSIRILQLKKQFISIRFEEQETMTNYLRRLKICSDHLREAGAEMQDQDLAYSMLAGLPESYDGIIMTFSNVEDEEFTSSKFGTTTRKEDKNKKNFTCYKCGKEGHIARSCRGKAKTPAPNFQPPRCSTNEIAGSEMLTALSCAIPDNSWVIDSGATHHVCNKREWFTNFQGITSDPILTASGTTRAEGCGDIKFKAYVGKHRVDLKLYIIEPTTFEQAINSKEAPYWRRAMKDELRSLEDRNTWTLSDLPLGKRPISSRWKVYSGEWTQVEAEKSMARAIIWTQLCFYFF